MNYQELKNRNRPEVTPEVSETEKALLRPYTPIVYAIPQEQWEAMITTLFDQGQAISEMREYMTCLLTRDYLKENLGPVLLKMDRDHCEEITQCRETLKSSIGWTKSAMAEQMADTGRDIQENMREISRSLKESLKARDLSPISLRMKWIGAGAAITTLCWAVLKVLKLI